MSLLALISSAKQTVPSNVVAPVLSGTPALAALLTVDHGTWRGSPTPTYTYQWQRLSGSTLPANTVAPALSGTPHDGSTLSAGNGTWTGSPTPTFSYQWQNSVTGTSGWADVSGATAATYVLGDGDVGLFYRCTVTATNSAGSVPAETTASTQVLEIPTPTASPTLSGTAQVGQVISTSAGTWAGLPTPTITYQWERSTDGVSFSNISAATSASYTVQVADLNDFLRCNVTGTNSVGNASIATTDSAQVIPANAAPTNTVVPAITGLAQQSAVLTSDGGTWTGFPTVTTSTVWQSSADGLTGWGQISAASPTYTVQAADVGNYIRTVAIGTNGVAPDGTANSVPVGPVTAPGTIPANTVAPVVSGTVQRAQVLTSTQGTWTGSPTPTYGYQWQVSADGLTGWTSATGSGNATNSYTVATIDINQFLRCVVTATNTHGSVAQNSAVTAQVASPYNPGSISGMNFWYKADSLSQADSSAVASWSDSSGVGHTATQGTGSQQPTFKKNQLNGLPALAFVRTSTQFLASGAPASYISGPGFTLFVVMNPTTVSTLQNLLGPSGTNGIQFAINGVGKPQTSKQNVGTISVATSAISAATWTIVTTDYANAGTSVGHHFTNGASNGGLSSSTLGSGATTTQLGAASAAGGFGGSIAEIIAFNRVLTSTERATVHSYLQDRYGISVSDFLG